MRNARAGAGGDGAGAGAAAEADDGGFLRGAEEDAQGGMKQCYTVCIMCYV